METKNPPTVTSSYHHQRAPRTPESYFNVPESVALLNIVKSERIQSAFQSNRKNHASVWEMVAEVLNRFSARKRTAKQCCNRYENLKKIYTQLKKNPERHVRRNWPYMFLFKEIEEQRGECWGSIGKRLSVISKNHNELSYYQRRRQAAELGVMLNKDNLTPHQHSLLQSLSHAHSTDSSQSGASKLERFLPNHFVETQLSEGPIGNNVGLNSTVYGEDNPLQQVVGAMAAAAAVAAQLQSNNSNNNNGNGNSNNNSSSNNSNCNNNNSAISHQNVDQSQLSHSLNNHSAAFKDHHSHPHPHSHGILSEPPETPDFHKDCNGALNLHHHHHHNSNNINNSSSINNINNSSNNDNNISMKSEPLSEGEFNPDDIQLMQTNYNGAQNFYSASIDQNILHPDVIVDTDNLSDCSSTGSLKSGKRNLSTSTDGDSTNYELIEYLKRREKRDEELLKRMDAREERLMNLLERTVFAIETLAAVKATSNNISTGLAVESTINTPATNQSESQPSDKAAIADATAEDADAELDADADAVEDTDTDIDAVVVVVPDEETEVVPADEQT